MTSFIFKSIAKQILLLGIFAFLIINIFGAGHLGMNVGSDGQMSNCPFMDSLTVCQMSPFEHIAAWQNIFTALPQKDIFYSLALLLLILFVFLLFRNFSRTPLKRSLSDKAIQHKRADTYIILNPLQIAFSDGILHPKIF